MIKGKELSALEEVLEKSAPSIRTIEPAQWNEEYRSMSRDVSPFPGQFSYDRTPYSKEIVNRFSPYDPARKIAVMKGSQIGMSTGVVEAGVGYLIDINPCNILMLTGHEDLSKEAMKGKIDQMIDSTGLSHLIKPNTIRSKRSGDTQTEKEFPGGVLRAGYAGNHKLLRQRSVQVIIVDDFDAAKSFSKESGDTTEMITFRQAAYYNKMKLFMISTPEVKQTSNIEPAFLAGDQRYYHIPCQCCGESIPLEWEITVDEHEKAGIYYEVDNHGSLVDGSVGYVCQKCGGFFDERNKLDFLNDGQWVPWADPSEPGYVSYHINALYAPPGMFDWERYVRQYLNAYPPGKERKEKKAQTFLNLVLGKTYEEQGEEPEASSIQKNIRPYNIGDIPDSLSQRDGNGRIILLTCAADLNGKIDDARLDYEIVGWSETGSSYSIDQGSIGTFIPRESQMKNPPDREKYTYETNKVNSVWGIFDEILQKVYYTDTGRRMKVFLTGIDAPGHFATQAYAYLDSTPNLVVALKGSNEDRFIPPGKDLPTFTLGKERRDLYMVEVNKVKDDLASKMNLEWDPYNDLAQPEGFMNFPTPEGDKYQYTTYFSHFESEWRVIKEGNDGHIKMRWEKKNSASQNHFWDVSVYNIAVRDIVVYWTFQSMKMKTYSWRDYVNILLNS